MSALLRSNRRWFWKGLLGLALLPLFPGSCQRRQQAQAPAPVAPVAPAPPPPNYLAQGDSAFDASDYAGAITAYSTYMLENPSGSQLDYALFRLGLTYALPGNPQQDSDQSIAYLTDLANRFPASPLRPQAELLARLEEQIRQLRSETGQREQKIGELNQQMDQLKLQSSEIERLQTELIGREERIRQLSAELDKLKAIDMRRRSTNPPR